MTIESVPDMVPARRPQVAVAAVAWLAARLHPVTPQLRRALPRPNSHGPISSRNVVSGNPGAAQAGMPIHIEEASTIRGEAHPVQVVSVMGAVSRQWGVAWLWEVAWWWF